MKEVWTVWHMYDKTHVMLCIYSTMSRAKDYVERTAGHGGEWIPEEQSSAINYSLSQIKSIKYYIEPWELCK